MSQTKESGVEGTVLLVKTKDESAFAPALYSVSFTLSEGGLWRGPDKTIPVYGEDKLKAFLKELGIGDETISQTIHDLQGIGSSTIPSVSLDPSRYSLFIVGFGGTLRRYMNAL